MDKPKLFLSSTFFDLEEHRDVLIQALGKTNCFELVVMENFGTQNVSPLDGSLQNAKETEFFILLLGSRYGYIPEGQTLSITNQEYKAAIGDSSTDVARPPVDRKKCVLPFLIDERYLYPDAVKKKLDEEAAKDGPRLTKEKEGKLKKLKDRITSDFILDKPFSSPTDLATKVLSALIPQLVARNYASLVTGLKLPYEIVYRCDREAPRKEFLYENFYNENFYRTFVIHGEDGEKPKYFSNNLEYYDLDAKTIDPVIFNMDDYSAYAAEKFLLSLTRDIHVAVFGGPPEQREITFETLTKKMIDSEDLRVNVIRFEIMYESWKEKYKDVLVPFFNAIVAVNAKFPKASRRFYFLMNIKYAKPKEEMKQQHNAFIRLPKLMSIQQSHIQQWVRTHFLGAGRTDLSRNVIDDIADDIIKKYFSAIPGFDKGISMETVKEQLDNIVDDFNENKNYFEDINKLFKK